MSSIQKTLTKTLPSSINKTTTQIFRNTLPKSVSKSIEKNIFNNKYVLYVVLFLAISNVIGYIMVKDFYSLTFFVVIGLLMSYITKNMVINLLTSMFLTNIFMAQKVVRESFKNKKEEKKQIKQKKDKNTKKTIEKLTNEENDDEQDNSLSNIDFSSTMDKSYKNLQKMLGDSGIQDLTKDTKNLINQQKDLMETLQSMSPLIKNAGSLMKQVNGLQDYASKLGISKLMGKSSE